MMKKTILLLLALTLLTFVFVPNCTMKGVELALVGTWNIDDYESDEIGTGIDSVDGTIVFTINDTYTVDMDLKLDTGAEYKNKNEDDGTTKADWTVNVIQFFTNSDQYDDETFTYTLSNWNRTLILKSSDKEFQCTKL